MWAPNVRRMADDDLAAVLTLLHHDRRRWRTLRAAGDQWADPERSREAFLRAVPPGGVVSSRGTPGPADEDPTWKLWMDPPRFRADYGGPHRSRILTIGDGRRMCFSYPAGDFLRVTEQRERQPHVGPPSELLEVTSLPTALHLQVKGRGTLLGREVFVVRGRRRPEVERRGPLPFLGADEVEFALDAERRVLLSVEQRMDAAPFRRVTMRSVAFDDELDAALFEFPGEATFAEASLPVPPEPRRPAVPHARQGPPDRVLGEPVGGRTVVARTDDVVIAVDRIVAYPSGFELGVTVRSHAAPVVGSFDESHRRTWNGSAAFPGESLHVSLVFADGRRTTMIPMHGHGTQIRYDQHYWVEPLPPPGPLGVVVAWERRGLPETRAHLDAGAIVEAAGRAQTLW